MAGCTSSSDGTHNITYFFQDQNGSPIVNASVNLTAVLTPDVSISGQGYTDENGRIIFALNDSMAYSFTVSNLPNGLTYSSQSQVSPDSDTEYIQRINLMPNTPAPTPMPTPAPNAYNPCTPTSLENNNPSFGLARAIFNTLFCH